ncbi:MAG: hypothetical protein A2234_07950 [Elusimicrobia bacterium RIFOXYA2_FULL_58_8]|nr:MAG: hypothetical protein A2234_07950 [Elusimicrobia bacterium RIFOXYA2_FULL_58_8]
MSSVQKKIFALPALRNARPSPGAGLAGFWARTKFSLKLIFLEKEIIAFAVLQWVCVVLGYYLWIQMIGWIPEEAWKRASNSDGATLGDIILFLWSFVCVGLVAFPLGILSGCMGAAHFLNRQGRESTIADCLKIVMPKAWALWIFHWIDGWWTVMRILDRLPKKNDRRTAADKALSEAMYYAWKIATIGILPALVTGRGLIDATRRSFDLVSDRFKDVVILRAGYSLLCWVIGVGAYIGAILLFMHFPGLVNWKLGVEGQMYSIYFWVAVPIIISTGVVMLFLRPVYVISACDIYADYVQGRQENLMLPPPPQRSGGTSSLIVFIILGLIMAAVFLYRYELGLMKALAIP